MGWIPYPRAFPNVGLSAHLYWAPQGRPGRWIGFDTLVTVGAGGIGWRRSPWNAGHRSPRRRELA